MNQEEMQARYYERNAEVERLQLEARATALHAKESSEVVPVRTQQRPRLGGVRHILGLG